MRDRSYLVVPERLVFEATFLGFERAFELAVLDLPVAFSPRSSAADADAASASSFAFPVANFCFAPASRSHTVRGPSAGAAGGVAASAATMLRLVDGDASVPSDCVCPVKVGAFCCVDAVD